MGQSRFKQHGHVLYAAVNRQNYDGRVPCRHLESLRSDVCDLPICCASRPRLCDCTHFCASNQTALAFVLLIMWTTPRRPGVPADRPT
jgi:hypothetical protein